VSLKFLVIQTSFLGDVILSTSVVEKLHTYFPDSQIDVLVSNGNARVLDNNPKIREVLTWDKRENKYRNLFRLAVKVRSNKYDYVINLHRFGSTGFITLMSGAKYRSGFHNNPFSFAYTHRTRHELGNGKHEVERNQELITFLTDAHFAKPKIYPAVKDFEAVAKYKFGKYICIAPGSVWVTKRLPMEKWVELCDRTTLRVCIIGSPGEEGLAQEIIAHTKNKNVVSLCRNLSLLQSAALMKGAAMNYVNDSAPLHLASAVNAHCTAFFCSTVPEFGFGPLSFGAQVVQTNETLDCKPCGVHGKAKCPKGHFRCGTTIDINSLPHI
jgi:ADP-heptose:LPS heptosyltransferase